MKKLNVQLNFKTFLILTSIFFSLAILVSLAFLILNNTNKQINTKIDKVNNSKLSYLSDTIDGTMLGIEYRTQFITGNKQLIEYLNMLKSNSCDTYQKSKISKEMKTLLTNISGLTTGMQYIYVISEESQYSNTNAPMFRYPLKDIQTDQFADSKTLFCTPYTDNQHLLIGDHYTQSEILHDKIYFAAKIDNMTDENDVVFVVVHDVLFDTFENANDAYIILDKDNNIIKGHDNINSEDILPLMSKINKGHKDISYKNYRLYSASIEFQDWQIIYAADMSRFFLNKNRITQLAFAAMLLSIILSFLFSNFVSNSVIKPIKKLTRHIKDYRAEDIGSKSPFEIKKTNMSFRGKLFFFYVITIIFPLLLFSSIFLITSNNTMSSYIKESNYNIFEKCAESIDATFGQKNSVLIAMSNDLYIQKILQEYSGVIENEEHINYMNYSLYYHSIMTSGKDWIGIYSTDNKLLASNGTDFSSKTSENGFYKRLQGCKTGIISDISVNELGSNVLSSGKCVRDNVDLFRSNGISGYIKMDIDLNFINEKIKNILNDVSGLFLYERDKHIFKINSSEYLSAVNPDNIIKNSYENININDEEYLVMSKDIPSVNMEIITILNIDSVLWKNVFVYNNYIIIIAFIMLMIFSLSYIISWRLMLPMSKINRRFLNISLDTMHEKVPENYMIKEISELGETYNRMLHKIDDLIDEVTLEKVRKSVLEHEKNEAEIISLQAQINPHFLYNTLNTINAMIKTDLKIEAVNMINSLSDLFRYGISRGEIVISIEKEIEHAKAYANIISFRYKNKVKFLWKIDERVLKYCTIKLVIQPFIENAINHGMKDEDACITITVIAKCLKSNICFYILDDGKGCDDKQLKMIKENLSKKSASRQLGIYNVQTRIKLHYGSDYGLKIDSKKDKGTIVTLTLPKQKMQ